MVDGEGEGEGGGRRGVVQLGAFYGVGSWSERRGHREGGARTCIGTKAEIYAGKPGEREEREGEQREYRELGGGPRCACA